MSLLRCARSIVCLELIIWSSARYRQVCTILPINKRTKGYSPISLADDLRRRGIVLRMRRFHAIVEMLARERPAQHGIHGAQARMRVRRRLHETQALVQSFEDDLESQLALSKATLRKIRQRISMGQKLVHLLQKRYDTLQVDAYYATNATPAATKETEG